MKDCIRPRINRNSQLLDSFMSMYEIVSDQGLTAIHNKSKGCFPMAMIVSDQGLTAIHNFQVSDKSVPPIVSDQGLTAIHNHPHALA